MSFSDYLKGPAHRQRAEALEAQLAELQLQHSQLQELVYENRRHGRSEYPAAD